MEKNKEKEKMYFCEFEKENDLHKICEETEINYNEYFDINISDCQYKTQCKEKYGLIKPCKLPDIIEARKNKETIFMVEDERTEELLCNYGYIAIHCDDMCNYKSIENELKNQNLFFIFPLDRTMEGKPMLKEYENMLHYFVKIANSVKIGAFDDLLGYYEYAMGRPRKIKEFFQNFENEVKNGISVTESFSLFR